MATEGNEGTAKKASARKASPGGAEKQKRAARLNQTDVPAFTLDEAMRVAEALRDDWAKDAASPLDLAASLKQAPLGSRFRMLTGPPQRTD